MERRRQAGDRDVDREVRAVVRMGDRGSTQRRESQRKRLRMNVAGCGRNERRLKQRRRRARIAQTEWRLRLIYGDGIALDHRIEHAIAGPEARLAGTAEKLA